MKWIGKKLDTIGDLMKSGIDKCETKEEAKEFMKIYRAENKHADSNIGYLSGYYSREEMARIQEWFEVRHPIFGRIIPTPKEALEAGMKMARSNQ